MNRVLFVAYYFPPVAASGAMRPLGFCRYLRSYGWQTSVVTTSPDSVYPPHPVDRQLETFLPLDVEVERVGYRDSLSHLLALRDRVQRVLSRSRTEVRSVQEQQASQSREPRSSIKDAVLDWVFAFPDRQVSWSSPAVKRIATQKRKSVPDVIFATGGPWSAFVVGQLLAHRFNRPLILDYRDPWTFNPYYSFSARFLTEKAKRLEKAICRSASRIIANTVELRDRLCAEYPEISARCVMIPNGYDEEMLRTSEQSWIDPSKAVATGYELCHFGTVYGKRTPRKLFRAFWELWKEGVLRPEHLRLRFVGAWESADEDCNMLARELEKHGFLNREPPIPHSECIQHMKRASVLLVVQPDSPLQVPGKIYEYIATGRPLLLVGGEGATANLVRRHNLGVSCINEVHALRTLLHGIVTSQIRLHTPDPHRIAEFDYRKLTGRLAEAFDTVVREACC